MPQTEVEGVKLTPDGGAIIELRNVREGDVVASGLIVGRAESHSGGTYEVSLVDDDGVERGVLTGDADTVLTYKQVPERYSAMTAAAEQRFGETRRDAAATVSNVYEQLTDNEDFDHLRYGDYGGYEGDPYFPQDEWDRAIGALRDLRDALNNAADR